MPQNSSIHRSLALTSLFVLTACPEHERIFDGEHCANYTGNAWCIENSSPSRPHCIWGFDGCPQIADGCAAEMPMDTACYSPCGGMQRLTDDPDQTCAEHPPTTSSTTTVAESTTTAGTTSSSTDPTSTTNEETTALETDATSTTDVGESSTESTGPTGCLGDEDCVSAAAPACDLGTGVCVPCSASATPDAACETFDSGTPVCFEDTCVPCTDEVPGACAGDTPACLENACVECTPDVLTACTTESPACGPDNTCVQCTAENSAACVGTTPLCDDTTNACVPCTTHDQCPAACDLETGACFPEDSVLHVDGDDGCSDSNPGSQALRLCTIQAAVDLVEAQGTIIVHALNGGLPYLGSVSIDSTNVVVILAANGEPTPVLLGTSSAALFVSGGAVVYLDGLSISGNQNGGGLEVASASRVHATDVTINSNDGVGVSIAGGSSFNATACRVVGNTEGGIVIGDDPGPIEETGSGSDSSSSGAGFGVLLDNGLSLRLVNCFVNGTGEAHAVTLNAGSADILYSSLAGRQTEFDASQALFCGEPASAQVRNSLLVAPPAVPVIECSNVDVSRSAGTTSLEGTSNENLGSLQGSWFEDFGAGNLCLANPPQTLLTAASWRTGDPTTDINGTLRPTQDGMADVAGADIPGDCE